MFIACADGGANRLKDLCLEGQEERDCVGDKSLSLLSGRLTIHSIQMLFVEIWILYVRK